MDGFQNFKALSHERKANDDKFITWQKLTYKFLK